MNSHYAFERAQAAEAFHRDNHHEADVAHNAALVAVAAERLATATRAWRTRAPAHRAEVDEAANQMEGIRRALADMRVASELQKK